MINKNAWWELVNNQLDAVRVEVAESFLLSEDTEHVTETAYIQAYTVLQILDRYDTEVPDIGWLQDGGIGFEWREDKFIFTMSIYGDEKIVYGGTTKSSDNISSRVKGTYDMDDESTFGDFTRFIYLMNSLLGVRHG